jgi:hypothetical protein
MKFIQGFLFFYRKLLLPSLLFSLAVAFVGFVFTGYFSLPTVSIGYFLLTPLFQYFIYELRNPNEYYFYNNLGLSRIHLWVMSLALSFLVCVISIKVFS